MTFSIKRWIKSRTFQIKIKPASLIDERIICSNQWDGDLWPFNPRHTSFPSMCFSVTPALRGSFASSLFHPLLQHEHKESVCSAVFVSSSWPSHVCDRRSETGEKFLCVRSHMSRGLVFTSALCSDFSFVLLRPSILLGLTCC